MSSKRESGSANEYTQKLLEQWGCQIDPELLVLALTHRSFANEMGGLPHNERLEFLGDSVLSIVVTEYLFKQHPARPESELARMRAATVSQTPLAEVARRIGLGEYILLGVGESRSGGRDKDSILSDTLEALIGATYLSAGLDEVRRVLYRHLGFLLEAAPERSVTVDWKTRLRAHALDHHLGEVSYENTGFGPDHARQFTATALINGKAVGQATASSKRHAENAAAREALLDLVGPEADPTLR